MRSFGGGSTLFFDSSAKVTKDQVKEEDRNGGGGKTLLPLTAIPSSSRRTGDMTCGTFLTSTNLCGQ